MKRNLHCFVVPLLCIALGASCIESQQTTAPLTVMLDQSRPQYTTDAKLDVTFRNTGTETMRILNEFDGAPLEAFFAFRLATKAGRRVFNIPGAAKVDFARGALRYVRLERNQEFKVTVPLDVVLPADIEPGEYVVSVIYQNQYGVDCFQGRVVSNDIAINLLKK